MQINFAERGGALTAVFSGEYDYDSMFKLCDKIKRKKEDTKTKGLILDFSGLNNGVSVFESFSFGRKLAKICKSGEKLVFLRKNGLLEGEGVCAEIIYNMGFNIEVFGEKEKAELWMKEE